MRNLTLCLIIVLLLSSCNKDDDKGIGPNQNSNQITVKSESTYNVNSTTGIVYGQGLSHSTLNSSNYSTMDLEMDVYYPVNNLEKRPAILLFHGGAFSVGSKSDVNIVNMANFFASRGWVAFSINYRLLSDIGTVPNEWIQYAQNNLPANQLADLLKLYPAHRDGKAAVRWIFANAETYNIDLNHITVGGGSAGAIIANAIGITENQDYTNEISNTADPSLASTNLEENYSVHTILDFWGSPLSIELLNDIYGNQRFGNNDAPIFIAHGTNDTTVPFSRAEQLRDEYINSGITYEFITLQGFGHSAWNATVNGKTLSELAFEFITEQQNLNVE